MTEHNRNLEEQLEEKVKIASGVDQKEREAKEALIQKEIMAQALTKKEKERAKTSTTREELVKQLLVARKELDTARDEKFEQARKIRELEFRNQKKDAKIAI